jgi:hypothetical protein
MSNENEDDIETSYSIIEIPELERFDKNLLRQVGMRFTKLDTQSPEMLFGGNAVFVGKHEIIYGTAVIPLQPMQGSTNASLAVCSHKIVFTLSKGNIDEEIPTTE